MESPVTSQDSNNSAPAPHNNSQSTTVESGYSSNINGKTKLRRTATSLKVPSASKVRKRKTATVTKLHNAKLAHHKHKVGHFEIRLKSDKKELLTSENHKMKGHKQTTCTDF